MDAASGALVLEKLGDQLVENSAFFSFAGATFPAKITYSFAGALRMEITQTMTALTDPANVLAAPANAQMRQFCKTYRRAFGQNMPQPKPGTGGVDTDIIVHGMIWGDGRVHDAVVESLDLPLS